MNNFKVLILILVLTLQISAQIKVHKTYSTSDGLVQNTINDILIDSFGYMWFATDAGVSRWDGINFKNYTVNNGLTSSIVMDIEEGADSTIYFATFGKGVTTFKDGVFDTLTTEYGLISDFVSIIKKFGDKIYLVSGGNIQKIAGSQFLDIGKEFSIPTLDINDFIITDSVAIIGSVSNGLFIYEKGGNQHFTSKNGLNGDFVTKILFDNDNNLIIGTDKGPNKLVDGKILKVKYNGQKIQAAVHHLLLTQNGSNVYSTSNGVYVEYNNDITNLDSENGFAQNIVWSAAEDQNSNLYFGTSNTGFCIYQNDLIESYSQIKDTRLENLTAFEILNNKNIVLGLSKDLLIIDETNNIKKFPNFSKYSISSLFESTEGTLFAATENGYLKYENRNKEFIGESKSKFPNTIYQVVEDSNKIKYLASTTGVIVVDGNDISRITKSDGIVGDFITSLYVTSDNTLLIGTHGQGFSSYKNGIVKNYTLENGLSDLTIQCFLELPDKSILIGTRSSGIDIIKNQSIFNINNDNGLLSNEILDFELDNSGNVYAATTNGLNIIDYQNGFAIRSITQNDGLVSNEIASDGLEIDDLGNLWVATRKGITKYTPKKDKPFITPPKVYINRLEIFNQAQDLMEFKLNPALNHDQNYLKFAYVGINLTAPHKTVYKYRLIGVDIDWVTSKTTNIQYTSLDDGDYIFEVKARNEWGYWSKPTVLRFTINPAWWETWWFYTLAFISIASLIAFITSYRYRHLLAVEKVRTKISEDLHDNIGSGLAEITFLSEMVKSQVKENEKANKGLNNITSISKTLIDDMRDIVWLVNPKNDTLKDLFHRLQDSYQEVLRFSDISLTVNGIDKLKQISLPMTYRQHIFLMFKEAINNSLKYSSSQNINIDVKIEGTILSVELKDDGKGFDIDNTKLGNGIKNMQKRAKLANGEVSIESGINKGTKIKFRGNFSKFRFKEI